MKKFVVFLLFACCLIFTSTIFAATSDNFEIARIKVYSNALGDKYAKVTVKNISSGSSFVEPDDFIGIFADGEERRGKGKTRTRSMKPGETGTIMIEFGRYKWPLEDVKFHW